MLAAMGAGDGEEACSYFSTDGLLRFERGQESAFFRAKPCAKEIVDLIFGDPGYKPSEPVVSPDGQQVAFDVNNPNQLSHTPFVLEPEGDGWAVALIGIQSNRKTEEALDEVEAGGITDFEPYIP